jgi:hypothetical protein
MAVHVAANLCDHIVVHDGRNATKTHNLSHSKGVIDFVEKLKREGTEQVAREEGFALAGFVRSIEWQENFNAEE